MNQGPFVSVVVPCYNHAKYLPEALQSVLEQTLPLWECIIVNDGSPDNTSEVARDWVARDARFRLVEKPNGGLSSARNAGIKAAIGEYILPLDADDILHPRFIEETIAVARSTQEFAIDGVVVSTHVKAFGESSWIFESSITTVSSLVCRNTIVCASLFTKSLWNRVGGYDENFKQGFEDWEFWLRCADSGATFKIYPEPLFNYRQHKSSMLTEAWKNKGKLMREMLRKNRGIFIRNIESAVCDREERIIDLEKQLSILSADIMAERNKVLSSKDFVVGRWILAPARLLARIYKSVCHLFFQHHIPNRSDR
jgi:hypothetical protein